MKNRLWGTQNYLDCSICDQPFLCYEYSRCQRHLTEPEYCSPEPGRGQYECCNQPYLKFMPFKPQHGCHYFTHVPKTSGGTVYSLFQKNKPHVLWKTEAELGTMSPVAVKLDILALAQRPFFNKWAKAESIHRGGFPDPLERPITASSKSLSQFDQRRKGTDYHTR